jgi:hypothetical protein
VPQVDADGQLKALKKMTINGHSAWKMTGFAQEVRQSTRCGSLLVKSEVNARDLISWKRVIH